MLKIFTAFIITLFSSGAMAGVCAVYLPSACIKILDSDISFHERKVVNTNNLQLFLDVEITCTYNMELEEVDDLKVGDIYYNRKIYKVSVPIDIARPVTAADNPGRLEDYIINFMKKKKGEPFRFMPQVVCSTQ